MMSRDVTTIKVKRDTWRSLHKLKGPGQTFDEVLSELLEHDDTSGETATE